MQQMLISNFLGWRLVMAQQLLIIQISFNYAGYQTINAYNSNFFGLELGRATSRLNFLGNQAGINATNASTSNFFGTDAG
jgi:hypothetical protein